MCIRDSCFICWFNACYGTICLERVGAVVRLGDTARSDGRAAGPIAANRALGASPTLGQRGGVIRRIANRVVRVLPAILEPGLRIGVAIHLRRRTLATAPRSDLATFPTCFGQRRVAFSNAAGGLLESALFVADRNAIHDRIDAGNAARYGHGMTGLAVVFDPAGQLDHAVVERTDVDGALAENRIVTEGFEDAFLQRLVVARAFDFVLLDVIELVFLLGHAVRSEARFVSRSAASTKL